MEPSVSATVPLATAMPASGATYHGDGSAEFGAGSRPSSSATEKMSSLSSASCSCTPSRGCQRHPMHSTVLPDMAKRGSVTVPASNNSTR